MYQLPILTDITKYIVSEYIPHDEITVLCRHISHIHINPLRRRVRKYNVFVKDFGWHVGHNMDTYIDNVVRIREIYSKEGHRIHEHHYDVAGMCHGPHIIRDWYGSILSITMYVHGYNQETSTGDSNYRAHYLNNE